MTDARKTKLRKIQSAYVMQAKDLRDIFADSAEAIMMYTEQHRREGNSVELGLLLRLRQIFDHLYLGMKVQEGASDNTETSPSQKQLKDE